MVVTCVAFTRSLPASAPLRELPIEAAATGHLDHRYVSGGRVRTGRLPPLTVGFRGRPIVVLARALHHPRVDLVDLVLEVDDPEAATYLSAFDRTAGAVGAELFTHDDERRSIAALHALLARELLDARSPAGPATTFRRLVFSRSVDAPDTSVPGMVAGHHLVVAPDTLEVHADTTVLPDERLGYEMVAGLSARATVLVDAIANDVDTLALAAGDPATDLRAVLARAAETQRLAVVVQREITAHRLLAPALAPIHLLVDEAMGVGVEGRRDLDRSMTALARLVGSLSARSVEQHARLWRRGAAATIGLLALLVVVALLLLLLVAGAD